VAESCDVSLPDGRFSMLAAGSGPPLVVLHRDTGRGDWGLFHELLATRFRVYAPSLPGFDASARPNWLRNVTDLSALVGLALDKAGIGQATLVGLGFGGWVAAEIAARSPTRVTKLVLHSPVGLKPLTGEILDQFLFGSTTYVRYGFADPETYGRLFSANEAAQVNAWEMNREMTTRVAWKPYMFNPALGHLLRVAPVPASIIWSTADRIVPRGAMDAYKQVLPDATYDELPGAGHHADLEAPEALARVILSRLAA
jgi:pimeloyl-ACP methyl ester carboxylesterase